MACYGILSWLVRVYVGITVYVVDPNVIVGKQPLTRRCYLRSVDLCPRPDRHGGTEDNTMMLTLRVIIIVQCAWREQLSHPLETAQSHAVFQ